MKNLILVSIILFSLSSCSTKLDYSKLSKNTWMLSQWTGHTLATKDLPTLQFNADDKFSGKSFCNSYGGSVLLVDQIMKFENIFSTKMYCKDLSDLETQYFKDLESVNSVKSSKGKLMLYKDGNLVMEFVTPL